MKRILTLLILFTFFYGSTQTLVTQGVGAVTNTTAEINVVLGVPAGETYTYNVGYVVAPGNPRTQGTNVNGPSITANPGVNGTKLTITGLAPNTTYNYSVVVQRAIPSPGGPLYYPDGSFTTKASATPPLPTPIYDFGFNGNLASSVGSASLTPAFFPAGGSTTYTSNGATANSAIRINSGITSTTVLSSNLSNIPQGISARTIAVRMAYTTTVNSTNSVFSWGAATNNRAFAYDQTSASAGNVIVYGNDVTFTNNVTNGTFFTLIVTYDGGSIRIYKDGALVSTTARGINTVGTTFKIGEDISGSRGLFADIDDLKIFNTVLTNAEVATLHQNMQPALAPTITAISTAPISLTSYSISYTLNPNGQNTTSTLQYGLSRTNLATTLPSFSATGNTPVSSDIGINGLNLNTKYYYRISATNSVGTTTTTLDSFTTQSSLAPSVIIPASNSVSNVRANSVTLNYILNANGASTTSVINYGTTPSNLNFQRTGATATGVNGTNVSANLTGLNSNTLYYYTITATNSVGSTTSSSVGNFTTSTGPNLSAISATAITTNSATINYSLGTLGANNYAYVRYGTTATNLATVSALHGPYAASTSWILTRNLTALNAGTQYFYQVVAYNGNNDSTFSAVQNFTTVSVPVPTLSLVSTSAVAATTATINYTVNANGNSTTTQVRYGTSASNLNLTATGTTATGSSNTPLTVNLTGLTANTQYFYSVEATNAGGNAVPVTGNFTTTAAISLPSINNVNHSNVLASGAKFTYTINPNGGSTSSIVYIGTTNTSFNFTSSSIATTNSTGNITQTVNGLLRNSTYFYRIEASNAAGSVQSMVGSFTTTNGPSITSVQFNQATTLFNANPTVNPNGSTTSLLVRWGLSESNLSNTVNGPTVNGSVNVFPSIRVTGLTPNTPYWFLVEATNSNGTAQSITYSATTPSASSVPTISNISVTNLTSSSATIGYSVNINPQFGFGGTCAVNYGTNKNNLVLGSNVVNVTTTATPSHVLTGLTNNTKYYYEVTANNLAGFTFSTLDSFTIGTVLPLVLNNFSANVSNDEIHLAWQTSQEINTSHFIAEYSTDGINFKSVATVTAKGNSNTLQDYKAIHQPISNNDVVYYRLKMVDKDGAYSYSNVLKVVIGNSKAFGVNIYPTITTGNITGNIISNKVEKVMLQVVNTNGQVVAKQFVQTVNGTASFNVNITNQASGTYVLQMFTSNGLTTKKVIKN
jgi:phosphodiesterase/alkaline phosphatase D-like protein